MAREGQWTPSTRAETSPLAKLPPPAGRGYAAGQYPNNNGVPPRAFPDSTRCCCCLGVVWQVVMAGVTQSFVFGYNLSVLNTSIVSIGIEYGWCGRAGSPPVVNLDCMSNTNFVAFVSCSVFIGATIGAVAAGSFVHLGRRLLFPVADLIFLIGAVSSCVSNSFSALFWARIIGGFAVGLVSVVVPTWIAEMTPAVGRGSYAVMHRLVVTFGIFIANLLGLPLTAPDGTPQWTQPIFDKVWWRVMVGLSVVPTVLAAALFWYTFDFETPQFYCQQRQYDDAANLLRLVNQKDDVSGEMGAIQRSIDEAARAKAAGINCCRASCMPEYRLVIGVGLLLAAFQQLSGINVIVARSNAIFADAGDFSRWVVTGFSVVITAINVVMTFAAMPLVENLGRRSLLMLGTLGQVVAVLPATICYWVVPDAVYTGWLAIVGTLVFIIFFAIAYGPVLWVYLFEIYPAEIRGAAAGAATAINWVFSVVMVCFTTYVGNDVTFTVFAVMSLTAFFIVLSMVRETKGRSIEESPYARHKPSTV